MIGHIHRIAAALAIGVVAGAAPAAAGELRIATLAPEGSLWMKQLEKAAEKIAEATDGRVVLKYYGGGSQGDERDVIRKMRIGQLDGAALTSVGLSMIYPGIRVLQLPHFFADTDELDYVRKKMWPYFQKKFREQGFELLTPGDVGWIYLFSTRPIRSRKDLERAKLWVWQGDPLASQLTDKLGFNGVPLAVPEVLPALASGRIDACFGSPLAAVALQWHTQVRYMTSLRVVYGIGGMVMRSASWQAMSPADRAVQQAIGRKLTRKTIERVRRDNDRALRALQREGMQIVQTPPEMVAEFERTAEKLWHAGVGATYTREELDMALRYRAEYRKAKGR
ncbi:MAG: hypothetical protein D6689_06455 [Deltaproteobacteria bacterium]|nr:MAG: hypothetical protein D6689_06455 [Deltaproteobacteria bacterium]